MDLLQEYGSENSSSSDEEVPPPRNTSSNESVTNAKKKRKTNKCIEIVAYESVSPDTFVRSVPHIPGNWAGHAFCPVPKNHHAWREAMTESVLRFQQHLQKLGDAFSGNHIISHIPSNSGNNINETMPPPTIHFSLSRPFSLQLSSVESFVEKLQQRLQYIPTIPALCVYPMAERVLVNDEGTRSFWTWPLGSASTQQQHPTLMAIMEEINSVLRSYNQPPYYDPPIFHISLASVSGAIPVTTANAKTTPTASTTSLYMPVKQVHCTFGTTKHFKIDLLQH